MNIKCWCGELVGITIGDVAACAAGHTLDLTSDRTATETIQAEPPANPDTAPRRGRG